MDELTAPLLRELIDHIEVYETQGVGKSRTQRITIYYRFVGYIDIPAAPLRTIMFPKRGKAWLWNISRHNAKESRRNACSPKEA